MHVLRGEGYYDDDASFLRRESFIGVSKTMYP
jgi:hypothetical protein